MSRPDRADLLARLRGHARPWHGPPPTLPELVDRASDRWFGLPPRLRAAVIAAGAVGLLLLAGAGAARSPWGPPVEVLVATVDLEAGAPVAPDHVRTERRPAGLVPDDAVRELGEVAAPRAAGTVVAGSILTLRHLAGDPITRGLADGRAAYPVDSAALPPLRAGQRLDLVAGDLEGRGRTLARDVRVVAVTDGTVWLDVARDDAPDIAAAALRDGLRVVLLPG